MVKVYNIVIDDSAEFQYVEYFQNKTHIYLVLIEDAPFVPRFIRVKKSQYRDDTECHDYEEAQTYHNGISRVFTLY